MDMATRYTKGDKVLYRGVTYDVDKVTGKDTDSPDYHISNYNQKRVVPASDIKKISDDVIERVRDLNSLSVDSGARQYNFSQHRVGEDYRSIFPDKTPMINTLWEIEDEYEPSEDDEQAMHGMTVIEMLDDGRPTGQYYLALTGGGMDMSWEIAETYVDLGYLPPSNLGSLPQRSSQTEDLSKKQRIVVEAMKRSHAVAMRTNKRDLDKLEKY